MSKLLLTAAALAFLLLSGCSQKPPIVQPADKNCSSCHSSIAASFEASIHGGSGLSCADCHDGIDAHLADRRVKPAVDYTGQSCASCHSQEYSEWEMSPHAVIPLDLLPKDPRVRECLKCHQAGGFAAVVNSGQDFKQARAPLPTGTPEPVTCAACHNVHGSKNDNLLRLEKAELCSTCHGGKWQNLLLAGTGGYHYSGSDYSQFANHPHDGGDRCVTCHMARTPGAVSTGGHTFIMRTPDGELPNTAACVSCHGETVSYDIGGKQNEIQSALSELRTALEVRNGGELPGFQPGTCNQCHRGGTLPFDHDPDLILENAYENYKLVDRDKSLGVHNPGYALQLLRDSLADIVNNYRNR